MLSNISNIIALGTAEDNPEYLNDNIKISNQIAILNALIMGLPFTIIFALKVPELYFIPIISIIIAILIITLSYFQLTTLSRFISSVYGCVFVGIMHGFSVKPGGSPLAASFALEMASAILPFIIFDLREKALLIFSSLFCFLILASYQIRIDYFNLSLELTNKISDSSMVGFALIGAVLQLFMEVLVLKSYNFKSDKKKEKIVNEAQKQNERLKKSEEILIESLKTLDASKEAEQRRLWITEGTAKFAKILRSINNSQELYDKILSELVKYLDTNQGAFYIVDQPEDNGPVKINLVSCYAYNRKKYLHQDFEPGEGLLGQCFYEKEIIKLTEIPEDYVDITSGLGQATPRSLIIIPLKLNNEVAGFIEVASFNTMDDYKISFLERVSENIASTIINNKINDKTTKLLAKSQEQTEMMRSQEEEMRQNFEELQATQEEMERVQNELRYMKEHLENELENKLKELQQYKNNMDVFMNSSSDTILYTDENGNIIMCNPRIEKMFGYSTDEVCGMEINLLFDNEKDIQLTDCFNQLKSQQSKFYYNFYGKSKLYGFKFPVEIKIGKGDETSSNIFSVMIRDISKQKKREENMKKSVVNIQKLQQNLMAKQQELNLVKKEIKQKDKEIASLKTNLA